MLKTTRERIAGLFRSVGSLLPGRTGPARGTGAVVRPWRQDSQRTYPTVGLTPARLLTYLQAADGGSPQMQYELFGDMLARWPRLAAVEATRRLALTGLDWELLPGQGAGNATGNARLDEVVEFCRDTLSSLDRFREVLGHLATAVGFGLAVAELVWAGGRLVDIVPVPHGRLCGDSQEPWRLRILTEEEPSRGVALDEYPNKWVVHRPRAMVGRPFEGGLLRASALLYLAQNLSFKDWLDAAAEQVVEQMLRTELEAARAEVAVLRGRLQAQAADAFVERGMRLGKIVDATSMDWRADYLRDAEGAEEKLARAAVVLPPGRLVALNQQGMVAALDAFEGRFARDAEAYRRWGIGPEDLRAYERAVADGRVRRVGAPG